MAKHACKGTVLQQEIAESYVAVAQVVGIDLSDMGGSTFDATDLDSEDDEKMATGRGSAGGCDFEVFYDPQNAGHKAIIAAHKTEKDWRVVYNDGSGSYDGFTSAALKYSKSVKLNDGLKMSVKTENTGAIDSP